MISLVKFKKIAFVGGGTGGHVTPIIALVNEHKGVNLEYIWIGGENSLEESEATKANIKFFPISTLKLGTVFSPKLLLYPFIIIRGIFQARMILLREKPDVVFSKGGPGSMSVGIASWLLMIPLWIHESDTVPGWTNRALGKIAVRIFLGFDTARHFFPDAKCTVVGQIINPELIQPRKEYRYWKTKKTHIFVICGSQGSSSIFKSIAETCKYLDVEWIIVLGLLNKESRILFADFPNITVYDWLDPHTIGSILSQSDLIITRGSATTLAEIDAFKKRKIIIPLSWSSQNHQYYNAMWYKETHNDTVLEDHELKDKLQKTITDTLARDAIKETMERKDTFLR